MWAVARRHRGALVAAAVAALVATPAAAAAGGGGGPAGALLVDQARPTFIRSEKRQRRPKEQIVLTPDGQTSRAPIAAALDEEVAAVPELDVGKPELLDALPTVQPLGHDPDDGLTVISADGRVVKFDPEFDGVSMVDDSNGSVSLEEAGLEHGRSRALALAEAASGLDGSQVLSLREFSTSAGDCTMHKTPEVSLTISDLKGGNADSLKGAAVECAADRVLGRWRVVQGQTRGKATVAYTCCKYGGPPTDCEAKETPLAGGHTGGFLSFAKHQVACPTDRAMTRWEMLPSGSKLRFKYNCCKMDKGWSLSECSVKTTTPAFHKDGHDVLMLQYHNVNCGSGSTLASWLLKQDEKDKKKALVEFKCCAVAEDLQVGAKESTCAWWGDPHFVVFDYKVAAHRRTHNWRHTNSNQMQSGVYWVIKSRFVSIQSEYCRAENPCRGYPAITRKIAIGGLFMRGHKLIIYPMRKNIEFDGKPIGLSGHREWRYNVNGLLSIRFHGSAEVSHNGGRGWGLYVELPLGVKITSNRYGGHLDTTLKMRQLPGGLDGHCGNMNGDRNDDLEWRLKRRQNNFIVNSADNLFKDGMNVPGSPNKAKLSDCSGEKKKSAEALCKKKIKANNDIGEAFMNMCVFDVCFINKDFGKDAGAADKEFEEEVSLDEPLKWKVQTTPASPDALDKACGTGYEVFVPKSQSEQETVEELVGKTTGATSRVLTAGVWDPAQDIWTVDKRAIDPMCSYTKYAYENWRTPPKTANKALCMRKEDGGWEACDMGTDTKFSVICKQKQKYAIMANSGPVAARSGCGEGKRLAMPKTESEQRAIFELVKGKSGTAKVWLGAAWRTGTWQWEDRSPVCGYTNWAGGQSPSTPLSGLDEAFMVMDAKTGKWENAGTEKTKSYNVACEIAHQTQECPKGKLLGKAQGMRVNGAKSEIAMLGHCFYLSKSESTCERTCQEQMDGGVCDQAGLLLLEDSLTTCRAVVDSFALPYSSEQSETVASDTAMCNYFETSDKGKVQLLKAGATAYNGAYYSTCTSKSKVGAHRVCSCKVDKSLTKGGDAAAGHR